MMMRCLLFFIVTVWLPIFCLSQRTFHFITEAGLTSSQISGDGFYGFGQFGGHLYIGAEAIPDKGFGAALLLGFNQKGARKYQSANDISTYRLRVNYFELPTLVTYHLEKWRFALGPGFNFSVNHRERNMFGDIEPGRSFKPFELAINTCVAYEVHDRVILNLWFQNSITPARDHAFGQAYPPSLFIFGDWHNALLDKGQYFTSLMLSLRFEIR